MNLLLSTGDYLLSGGDFGDVGATLTIHRTQKYQAGADFTDYESTHDYEIESLGFIRIYPEVNQS